MNTNDKELSYLVVGTGGVGGCMAGFLALAGKQVSCMASGHESEVQGLLFDILDACETEGIDCPTYRMVAQKFKPSHTDADKQ